MRSGANYARTSARRASERLQNAGLRICFGGIGEVADPRTQTPPELVCCGGVLQYRLREATLNGVMRDQS